MHTPAQKYPTLFVAAAAILWGTIGFFFHYLSAYGLSSMQVVLVRVAFSAMFLTAYLAVTQPQRLVIRRKDSWMFIGTGIISLVWFNFCYFQSIQFSSLSIAAILLYTAPIWVAVLSVWLFGEKMNSRKITALCLAFLGCVLVAGISRSIAFSAAGILFGLGSGLGYALYSIFARYALARYHTLTITAYTFLFATLGALPFADFPTLVPAFQQKTLFFSCVSIALLGSVIPYLLYTQGLTYLESSKAAIIASLEPVVATLISIFCFHEPMDFYKILGILLILTAVALLNKGNTTPQPQTKRLPTEK